MNGLIAQDTNKLRSDDFLLRVNSFRADAGEKEIRYNDFIARVQDELASDNYESFVVQNSNNTKRLIANLTTDQAMLVGMRESKAVRRQVMDYIKRLENKSAIPQTYAAALLEAGRLAQELEDAKPKIEFVDKFVSVDSTFSLREALKLLNLPEKKTIALMIADGVVTRKGGSNSIMPIAKWQHKGYFIVKTGTANDRNYSQTRVTAPGFEWLAKRYSKEPVVEPKKLKIIK